MAGRFYWFDPTPLQEKYLKKYGYFRGEGPPRPPLWTTPTLSWKTLEPLPGCSSVGDALYLIAPETGGLIKIGRAKDVARRLKDLNRGSPVPLVIRHVEPGLGCCEFDVHKVFHARRKHGEWFDFADTDPVAAVVAALDEMGAREWLQEIRDMHGRA